MLKNGTRQKKNILKNRSASLWKDNNCMETTPFRPSLITYVKNNFVNWDRYEAKKIISKQYYVNFRLCVNSFQECSQLDRKKMYRHNRKRLLNTKNIFKKRGHKKIMQTA